MDPYHGMGPQWQALRLLEVALTLICFRIAVSAGWKQTPSSDETEAQTTGKEGTTPGKETADKKRCSTEVGGQAAAQVSGKEVTGRPVFG
ncbi:hypothetical protein QBC46DRAFT_401150 [Diplogelasinospora grovesii]|uniref:Secreted mucin n=1 Tax=Diplogelasinospora grovesii TaxID=303347 RepID=A0AAN6MUQ2_9PEZI|nr:hypothetical protein QBC46DRAFT_401150 [Diplogelasinospora grovesii]